ncbi:MAG: phosphoribosyltransferase [Patescibacteria group bacterium]|nr:phosphoribosyltransferase [Patescibacteria group bacterium]
MSEIISTEVIDILKKVGAVITDSHIVGTSGRHMSVYINKDALYPHTRETSRICELFADKYKSAGIEVVAAPSLGGIVLETWTAYHLTQKTGKEVLGVYTEKDADKNQIFTRGYDKLVAGKNVLVIEDLTTTGGSVAKVVNSVKNAGGNVVAVCVMVNRDPAMVNTQTLGFPFDSLAILKAESWEEKDCPLCEKHVPINTTVGHGKKYLEAKKKL